MKKITVIGKGLAGSLAIKHFEKYYEVECLYTNDYIQNVGISSALDLYLTINDFTYEDIKAFNGNHKTGVHKLNFNKDYFQSFIPPFVSVQFNSKEFVDFINNNSNALFKQVDSIDYNSIDTDYIIDCSGVSKLTDDYYKLKYIPVNAAISTKIKEEHIDDFTTISAQDYGWISRIPTLNGTFVSYIFNKDINTKDEILSAFPYDVKEYQYFEFNNYYHKKPFSKNIFYNGNKAFFIEPFEGTALSGIVKTNSTILDIIENQISIEESTKHYNNYFKEAQDVILMHYLSTNKNTAFWDNANKLAEQHFINNGSNVITDVFNNKPVQSFFYDNNLYQYNIDNLGIRNKLKDLLF